MGCDIHGYIEYEDFVRVDGTIYRSCFGENLGERDYAMFGLLAGVRHGNCLFAPRGLPEGISHTVRSSFCLFIVDDSMSDDGEGFVRESTAEKWLSDGSSERWDDNYITHPDWHTPSWLDVKEYEKVLRAREENTEYGKVNQEWYAILAAMKVLKNARFVFWFDN